MHVDAEGGHFNLILVEALDTVEDGLDRLGRKLAGRRIFTTG
jgi:hypothetical protein